MNFLLKVSILVIHSSVVMVLGTTHWVVTEDGNIQAQMDSTFQLRRPYDFLALAQQEQRAVQVETMKKELISQKAQIDQNEDKDMHLEERIYRTNSDCILAGRPLLEFDLYATTVVDLEQLGIRIEDHLGPIPSPNDGYLLPDCSEALQFEFSMFSLEHLEGVRFRSNLTGTAEESLASLYGESNPAIWGHRVGRGLLMNSTDWVLHNLGARYWRLKADPRRAIECLRRALHYAPREYRYIPLVHLGNVLHRAHQSEEAAIALHMSIDHYKHCSVAHMTLGNVYGSLGHYNVSVLCYENALYMLPNNQEIKKRKYAVLCHSLLESKLEKQHQSLQRTLNELRDYQKHHEEWLSLQQKLLLEQATPEMKLESRLEYEEQKIRESTDGRGQDCFQYQQDGHTFLSCNMRRDQLEQRSSPTELLLDLQSLLHTVESEALRLRQHALKRKILWTTPIPQIAPIQKRSRSIADTSSVMSILDNVPSPEICEETAPLPQWDGFPTVYLSPENKGFLLNAVFGDVEQFGTVPLPCVPPVCSVLFASLEGIDSIASIRERHLLPTFQQDHFVESYLSDVEIADLAGKISIALKKGLGPKWLLYNLAGLYWRVEGNLAHGVECFRHAISTVPVEWKDVPLVNLAALLYSAGHIDDALTLTLEAIKIDSQEPETNFLLANLYCGKGNLTGALHHYQQVLLGAPSHTYANKFTTALACHIVESSSQQQPVCENSEDADKDKDVERCGTAENDEVIEMIMDDASEDSTDDVFLQGPSEEKVSYENIEDTVNVTKDSSILDMPENEPLIKDDPLPDVLLRVRERIVSPPPPRHACERANKLSDMKHFTSTWLSVSAKDIDIREYLIATPLEGTVLEEPLCNIELPSSMDTLDHLSGVRHRKHLPHYPEMGLREALQTLTDRTPVPVDLMATRISRSLEKNETSWVLATAAALYWRVVGSGYKAVDCLRNALHYSPRHMKDIPLVSLANILHRAGLYNNALVVANMALEISPKFVVIHFTMANIYAAKGDLEKATAFYQSTLALQSSFEPARDRLRAIQCSSTLDTYSTQ